MAQDNKKSEKKVIKRTVTRISGGEGEIKATPKTEAKAKKVCYFCKSEALPSYTDVNTLRKFLTERGKIVPKLRSGSCSKHQRRITSQIKYARHLGLLPFTQRV